MVPGNGFPHSTSSASKWWLHLDLGLGRVNYLFPLYTHDMYVDGKIKYGHTNIFQISPTLIFHLVFKIFVSSKSYPLKLRNTSGKVHIVKDRFDMLWCRFEPTTLVIFVFSLCEFSR